MGAQTNSRLVGLLLVALSLVLLLPLSSTARISRIGRESDSGVHYQDDPANPKWDDPEDTEKPPGERMFGPFWSGCGRLRAYQANGWPKEWPRRSDNYTWAGKPKAGSRSRRQEPDGQSRIAFMGNRVVGGTEFPSHVTILTSEWVGMGTRCAGVLIADRLVLTTRKCFNWVIDHKVVDRTIVYASWRTQPPYLWPDPDFGADGKMLYVENLCLSNATHLPKDRMDVQWAIVRVKERFCFSDKVFSACLPRQPFWDPHENTLLPEELHEKKRMIVQVGGNHYDINPFDKNFQHLRAYIHRNIFKCMDEEDRLAVCSVIETRNNFTWDPMCWRDAGAGGYVLDSLTDDGPRDRLTVASIVGHQPMVGKIWNKFEPYEKCRITSNRDAAIYKSMDVHEALEHSKLKEAIETCGQGLYGYPEKKLNQVVYI